MEFTERGFLKPYFIAEIGVNHEGDLDRALSLVDLAKAGGADAAKFQTYKADKLAAKNSPAYWDTNKEASRSQIELFKKYDSFGQREYEIIAQHCQKIGIDFVSTPFDLECLEWLIPMVRFVKIASADITNFPLISACAAYDKPMVVSVGAATDEEIAKAVDFIAQAGIHDPILLHCVLNYPTPIAGAHLFNIERLMKLYDGSSVTIGYSDHVPPDACNDEQIVMATLMGVTVIEKHFTDDKSAPGNDHYHALDKDDLLAFQQRLETLRNLWGGPVEKMLDEQKSARKYARRSLYYRDSYKAGTAISAAHIIAKRPAAGLEPNAVSEIEGRVLTADVEEDSLVAIEHFQ